MAMQATTTWGTDAHRALDGLAPLVLVSGKGGVGKTFVARRLAARWAAAGQAVTLVRLGDDQSGPAPALPGVTVLTMDPLTALRRQAGHVLGSARLARFVLDQRPLQGVLELIPGVSEVALMLSFCELLAAGQDRVIVDMPATGHGLALLTAPQLLLGVVDGGRAFELTLDLQRRLGDATRTALVAVTTAEAFVLRETQRLVAQAQEVGVAPALVVVNRLPQPAAAGTLALARRLAGEHSRGARARGLGGGARAA